MNRGLFVKYNISRKCPPYFRHSRHVWNTHAVSQTSLHLAQPPSWLSFSHCPRPCAGFCYGFYSTYEPSFNFFFISASLSYAQTHKLTINETYTLANEVTAHHHVKHFREVGKYIGLFDAVILDRDWDRNQLNKNKLQY